MMRVAPSVHERGSISAFVVCCVISMVCLVGLALDGGRVVAGYVDVADAAQNAARMGDQFLVGLRQGRPRIDEGAGTRAVREYLAAEGLTGRVEVAGRMISVTVRTRVDMRLLSLLGISSREITVTRQAELVEG